MLELKNILKEYVLGGETSVALKNVNLSFGESEFVSILGQSGSGKTTLLNIIGGLDQYTSGDLIVDGTSTKNFKAKDWDSYRNGTIGFVFQSYNLISHLSILDNVKMALSLSGITSKEGEERSRAALEEVGLGDHINKKPNQLSGGQMQRVAIARALVNNPKIILADEPTGALDSKTSVQIMDLIKKISQNRLVIMVTHNPELSEKYSDRIIRVQDGEIIEDTAPYTGSSVSTGTYKEKKTAMSMWTAIKSSAKNLMTKKSRTSLVTLAGSIGIISIALVLSLSAGMTNYIDTMQEDSLGGTPITISSEQSSVSSLGGPTAKNNNDDDSNSDVISPAETGDVHTNIYSENILDNGETFIDYFEKNASDYYSSLSFETGYSLKALTKNDDGNIQEVSETSSGSMTDVMPSLMGGSSELFSELPEDNAPVLNQYNILSSTESDVSYPTESDEAVVIVGSDNTLSPSVMAALGYASDEDIEFDNILGKEISVIDNDNYYTTGVSDTNFITNSIDSTMYDSGTKVKIVAILQAKESTTSLISGSIGYTKALIDDMIAKDSNSEIVTVQKENETTNVLSPSNETVDDSTYNTIMEQLGGDTTPTKISIYPTTFDDRTKVTEVITDYNNQIKAQYSDSDDVNKYSIQYSDMAQTMTDTMSTMINTITIILTAFSAISLVVSSIMIGILTYVSVVERTKEIGIMRAIGARKKDITRIFNAEAAIIGLISGVFGVGIAMLCSIPINSIVNSALGVTGFSAGLSTSNAIILIILSVALTFIAGFIPSKGAAKKDPVEALRNE